MPLSLLLAMMCALAAVAGAQVSPPTDTIAEARRLRDSGDFAGAATIMRPYVESHPDDMGSARFAALMAYWGKQREVAESIYANAIARHGDDVNLRLEYGRFLIETGRPRHAHDVLDPVIADDQLPGGPAEKARAHTLLGTAAYWQGDFTTARREFATAVQLDSSLADARRQLGEIDAASAPWVRVGSELRDDDQPLRALRFDADGAWYLNPLTPLGMRAGSIVFDRDGASESLLTGETHLATYLPAAHLDFSAALGILERSFDSSTDWTARSSLGVRLPRTVVLGGRYERSPYTNTIRSLGRAIMVQTVEASVRWGQPRGWMGEAVGRRELFPDDNHTSTGFGWLLAPLWRHDRGTLHVGYGFSAASAEASRFQPRGDLSVVPLPPGQTVPVNGEYNPYYTPRNLRVHSVLANFAVRGSDRWSVGANGRYGVSAHDDAPVLVAVSAPPSATVQRRFYSRSFTPWNTRATFDVAATRAIHIGLAAEREHNAFYSLTVARAQITYTFLDAAERRADIR